MHCLVRVRRSRTGLVRPIALRRAADVRGPALGLVVLLLLSAAVLPVDLHPATAPRLEAPSPPALEPTAAPVRAWLAAPTLAHAPLSPAPLGSGGVTVTGTTVLAGIGVGINPTTATVDTATDNVYVTNFGGLWPYGNSVSVINGTNNSRILDIAAGDDPIDSTYDAQNGNVYVMNYGITLNVSVLHGTRSIGSLGGLTNTHAGVYDPSTQEVYIAEWGTDNVTLTSGTQSITSLPAGSRPTTMLYDPSNHDVYAMNYGGDNLTVYNAHKVVANVVVGDNPLQSAYDSSNGWIYVPNSGSGNVSVVNGTKVVGSVYLSGLPFSATYDPANQLIYVPNSGTNTVDILRGTSLVANVSVGTDPRYAAYDGASGLVYVNCWTSDDVVVFNGTSIVATIGVGLQPYDLTYDPLDQEVFVTNYNSNNVTAIGDFPHSYPVTFTESGLPISTLWGIQIGATSYTTNTSSITIVEPNGSYSYGALQVPNYATNGTGNFTVSGAAVSVSVTYVRAYPVTFQESGLPAGANWTVSVLGDSNTSFGSSMVFWEANGTIAYFVSPVPNYSTSSNGSFRLSGSPLTVPVVFRKVLFPVDFHEVGLASPFVWSVTLLPNDQLSSDLPDLGVNLPNGTYNYTVQPVPSYASNATAGVLNLTVQGAPVTVTISFRPQFSLLFQESGLPSGTLWTVNVAQLSNATKGTSLGFLLTNGTYNWTLTPIAGYTTSWTGSVTIDGSALDVPIDFSPYTYLANFTESGLAAGTTWYLTVGGMTYQSSRSLLSVPEPNGSYAYSLVPLSGYRTPPPGRIAIDAAGIAVSITWVPVTFPVRFYEVGLGTGDLWGVNGSFGLTESRNASITLPFMNGSYTVAILPVAGFVSNRSVTFTVDGGALDVPVVYTPFTYPVTFVESGLPGGANWSIEIGSSNWSSTAPTLVAALPNGSYIFGASAGSGYRAPPQGEFAVNGAPLTVNLSFAPAASPTFLGLPLLEGVGLLGVALLVLVVGLLLIGLRARRRARDRAPDDAGEGTAEEPEPPPSDEPPEPFEEPP